MSEQNQQEHILLFRDNNWHKDLSPEEMQEVATRWMAWFERLKTQGKIESGRPLLPQGKLVSGKGGRIVADGPFAESKETIGGYFLLRVDSLDEAVAIAQECPGLSYGCAVEVRPVAALCPAMKAAPAQGELVGTGV